MVDPATDCYDIVTNIMRSCDCILRNVYMAQRIEQVILVGIVVSMFSAFIELLHVLLQL